MSIEPTKKVGSEPAHAIASVQMPCASMVGTMTTLRPYLSATYEPAIEGGGAAAGVAPPAFSAVATRRARVLLLTASAPIVLRAPSGAPTDVTSRRDTCT